MSEMTKSNKSTMDALRNVYGTKMLGQDFEMSKFLDTRDDMIKVAIERIAASLVEAVVTSGSEPILGTHKVQVEDSWMGDRTLVAGKINVVLSDCPEQFLVFAAYQIEEARRKMEGYRIESERSLRTIDRLVGMIAVTDDVEKLREEVRKMENE